MLPHLPKVSPNIGRLVICSSTLPILSNSSLGFSMTPSNLLATLSLILTKTVSNSRLRLKTELLIKQKMCTSKNELQNTTQTCITNQIVRGGFFISTKQNTIFFILIRQKETHTNIIHNQIIKGAFFSF